MSDPADIQLNEQYDIQELMGEPPGWLLRYGILVVAAFLLGLVALAYVVRFPDRLTAPGLVTSAQPPVRVAARTDGELAAVLVADRDTVQRGQLLLRLANPADPAAVARLADWLSARADEPPEDWTTAPAPALRDLGELQPAYSELTQHLDELRYFLRRDKTARRIRYLRAQISELEGLAESRTRQAIILAEEVRLAARNLTRDSLLTLEGARSERELERARAAVLDGRRRLEDLRSTGFQNNIQIQELRRRVLDLQQQQGDTASDKVRTLREDYGRLRSAVAAWRTRYEVRASAAGVVALSGPLPTGRFVRAGEDLFTLLPLQPRQLLARAALPLAGAGKVRAGMTAYLRLADYPYQKYGTLTGEVYRLALLPQDDSYEVLVALPDSLVTTHGYALPFRQEMRAQITVITEDRRLLLRLFDRLYSLVKNPRG